MLKAAAFLFPDTQAKTAEVKGDAFEERVLLLDLADHGAFDLRDVVAEEGDRAAIPAGAVDFPTQGAVSAGNFDCSMRRKIILF